ncbi:hypothetical protein QYE76_024248 [Lolium multiflorum]|uniref:Reverse transcriptase domain-containing protein n=1 Tax=Lolium multiflorum TaxID=4521 RepID=A0AAD8RDM1_LOLMU|nr:hypothetical protein QYE76_024248 [Lolium multiflorum]
MADGTPVTYEDLTEELKKKYDEVKAILEADLIGSFHEPAHMASWKGFSPGALDGVDLSARHKNALEKKDGRWRVAIDFRDLNRATPKDEYPMLVAETLINAAAGHKVLSFMDGNAGYNQIFMAPEDIHKTAFRVPGSRLV